MLKKKMKEERIYTVKNTNDFIHNCNEETKLSFNLPSGITQDMITGIARRKYKTIIIYDLHDDKQRKEKLKDDQYNCQDR